MKDRGKLAIVYDCPYPFVQGGGQKRLFEIARRLHSVGWDIHWYSLRCWDGEDTIDHSGITYHGVGRCVRLYGEDGKRDLREALYFGWKMALCAELRGYDIVHAGQWPYFHIFSSRLYSALGRGRLVVDWWEVWGRYWKEYFPGTKAVLGMLLERSAAHGAGKLVSISSKGREQLCALNVPKGRITVIPNGIDFERIQSAKKASGGADLIYMGRLKDHKNVDHLLRAVNALSRKGLRLTVDIVGDGPERAGLEQLVDTLGMRAQVAFHGAVGSDDDVYGLMKAAKLFVHPSTKEGGGSITSLEANACGLPVVAYRHENGLSPELIQESVNGYWAEPEGWHALADCIKAAWEAGAKAGALRESCVRYSRDFDWDVLAGQYDTCFSELMAGPAIGECDG